MDGNYKIWMEFKIFKIDEQVRSSVQNLQVLGASVGECISICLQTLEPGESILSYRQCGSVVDYMNVYGADGMMDEVWGEDASALPGENNIVRFYRKRTGLDGDTPA